MKNLLLLLLLFFLFFQKFDCICTFNHFFFKKLREQCLPRVKSSAFIPMTTHVVLIIVAQLLSILHLKDAQNLGIEKCHSIS